MSSEDEAPEGQDEGLVFPLGTDPETQRIMTETVARRRMAYTDASHNLFTFLRELSNEQKITLRSIFSAIETCERPASLAGYYQGLMSAYLDAAGICPTCEKNHGDELSALLGGGA